MNSYNPTKAQPYRMDGASGSHGGVRNSRNSNESEVHILDTISTEDKVRRKSSAVETILV